MSYNTELQNNNLDIENLIQTAYSLPNAAADDAVLYTEQTRTDDEKAQARANIGAQVAGNYALKTELPSATITMVGIDENGVSHTWTVYGAVIA